MANNIGVYQKGTGQTPDIGAYEAGAAVDVGLTRRTRRTGLFFPQPNRLLRTFRGKRPS